jgi:type IX secretion system substrate protein
MKKIFLFSMLICFSIIEIANAQNWLWSKQIGGNDLENVSHLCVDQNDNIYVTSSYQSNPCYFSNDTLTCNGFSDFYITKYDASGNELWVKHLGSVNNANMQSEGIACIKYNSYTNSIFVSGGFRNATAFDSDTLTANNGDGFVARLDLNGNFIWVKQAGGIGPDGFLALDIDQWGNVYAELRMPDSGTIDTVSATGGVYFVKYDSNGNFIWAQKKFNINVSSQGYDGFFLKFKIKEEKLFALGLCTIDTFMVDTVNVYANFANGQYVLGCFDTSGTALWVKTCSSSNLFANFGLDVDDNKNSYITGSFYQSGIFENDTITNNNFADLFIAKYDSSGNFIWVRQTNVSVVAGGYDVALSADAGVYITGIFNGTADFGTYTVNSVANGDMFVARYDTSGLCIGVRHLGAAFGYSIVCNGSGDFYCSGQFTNTVTFGTNPSLTSYGQQDIYVAKSSSITGIGGREINPKNQLIIYANPTKGTCSVTIPDEFKHEKKLTLQIFDNTGKLLQQTKVEMQQEKVKVNLEEEAKGVYNVTLSNGKKSYNGKIVFE